MPDETTPGPGSVPNRRSDAVSSAQSSVMVTCTPPTSAATMLYRNAPIVASAVSRKTSTTAIEHGAGDDPTELDVLQDVDRALLAGDLGDQVVDLREHVHAVEGQPQDDDRDDEDDADRDRQQQRQLHDGPRVDAGDRQAHAARSAVCARRSGSDRSTDAGARSGGGRPRGSGRRRGGGCGSRGHGRFLGTGTGQSREGCGGGSAGLLEPRRGGVHCHHHRGRNVVLGIVSG